MRILAGLLLALATLGTALASSAPSFEQRLSQAQRIENEPVPHAYIKRNIFPAMRAKPVKDKVADCIRAQGAKKVLITMVATISPAGRVVDVDYRPGTNKTGHCLVNAVRAMRRLPPPPADYAHGLPIYIDWDLTDDRK